MPHIAIRLGQSVQRKSFGASALRSEPLNAPYLDCLLYGFRLAQHQISQKTQIRSAPTQTGRACYQESV